MTMRISLLVASFSMLLIAIVYTRGIKLNPRRLLVIQIILSLMCSGGGVFVWQLLNMAFYQRSLFAEWQIDRMILIFGSVLLFFSFMVLRDLVSTGPVGFDMKNLNIRKNARSFVYADSIPIKGDGWVRR